MTTVANLPLVSTTLGANCHLFQRHRRQIMGTISGCRHLKVNLKAKIDIYVNSSTQRCSNKIIKIFLIEDFFHLPSVSTDNGGSLWTKNISANFRKNLKRPYWYTHGLGGNWFMKKTRSWKSHGIVPLSLLYLNFLPTSFLILLMTLALKKKA
jgi:hypothetical protein